jgi:hypothetical protein
MPILNIFSGWHADCYLSTNMHTRRQPDMEEVKIYGLCLERLRYQIGNAKKKVTGDAQAIPERILLESYNSADLDDIIDILELYDVEDRTENQVRERLEELAYTVSLFLRDTLTFDVTNDGHLGLYLLTGDESLRRLELETVTA